MENKTKIMIGAGVVVLLGTIAYLTRKKWLPKKKSSEFSNMEDEVAEDTSGDLNNDGYTDAMDYAYQMGMSAEINNPLPIISTEEKQDIALVMAMADATNLESGDMTMADVVAMGGSEMTIADAISMANSMSVDVPVAMADVVDMGGGNMTMADVVTMSGGNMTMADVVAMANNDMTMADVMVMADNSITMADVIGINVPMGSDMGSGMVMADILAGIVDKAENKVETQMGNATIVSSSGGDNLAKLVADMGSAEQIMSKPIQESVLSAKDKNKDNPNTPNFTPTMPSKQALIRSKLVKGVARVKKVPTAKKVAIALALGGGAGLLLGRKLLYAC